MKIVIQCASRKHPAATFPASDGRPILFLAHPELAPRSSNYAYARPDDLADDSQTWRRRLLNYNKDGSNLLKFIPAYQLYAHQAYERLVDRFGIGRVFILSAGWGLIPATFLIPRYDITFTATADPWKRRRQQETYDDFSIMPNDGGEIVFIGGKDYLPMFCRLTAEFTCMKTVFFNALQRPKLPSGFRPVKFQTRTRTNWHYECANAIASGEIEL